MTRPDDARSRRREAHARAAGHADMDEARLGACFTQPHALELADLDGDGLKDIVVGKRYWAHGPTGDVEPSADPVLYGFRLTRDGATRIRHPAARHPRVVHAMQQLAAQLEAARNLVESIR